MKRLLLFSTLLAVTVSHSENHGYCPQGWSRAYNVCYKTSVRNVSFLEAVRGCMGTETGQQLINIGQIRKFGRTYQHLKRENLHQTYRVNAVWNDNLFEWQEHPSGRKINFKSFPSFDINKLWHKGATLVWKPYRFDKDDELQVVDMTDKTYEALCYLELFGQYNNCERKYGYADTMCTEGGDCEDGVCVCDDRFSGNNCEIAACESDCNKNGVCDPETGHCMCPGFHGINCEYCKTGLETIQNGRRDCYIVSDNKMTYNEAERWCDAQNAPMVEVYGIEEASNVKYKLERAHGHNAKAWMGGSNQHIHGSFTWRSTGRFVGGYTNWDGGHPTDGLTCAVIDSSGKWHASSCGGNRAVVCMVDSTYEAESKCDPNDPDHCYAMVIPSANRIVASTACSSISGSISMPEIYNDEDNALAFSTLTSPIPLWLGLLKQNDIWEWVDSETILEQYTNWAAGEPEHMTSMNPEDDNDNDCMVVSADDGKWRDEWCGRKNYAICQYSYNVA